MHDDERSGKSNIQTDEIVQQVKQNLRSTINDRVHDSHCQLVQLPSGELLCAGI